MLAPPLITTSRLILRLAEDGDVPALLHFYLENVDHLAPTSPLLPPDFLTEAFMIRQVARNNDDFVQGGRSSSSCSTRASPQRW
jgi:hypothetical protein